MAFDIDRYSRNSAPVEYDDLDYAAFQTQPLSEAGLRCLRYMCDVETHTICYLRDLLVTPSHTDPEITTFLTMWAFEEYWHGEALARVLDAHGITTGAQHIHAVRKRLGWRDRWAPIQQAMAANIVGEDFVAVHMSWGAINEWSTYAGYERLIEKEDHPVLTELLNRIMRQETKHVAFYVTQARERLERSAWARKITRFALRKFWAPVGSGVMPDTEVRHLLTYLFSGVDGRHMTDQIEEHIDQLPGLANLQLIRRASMRLGVATA